ncbi:MAG: hypothetical protein HY519_02695, partial [Candidatus Aenigmarchaeota archaeon]|nr:hypothetical protein [Candidatus Aenigmarchaeota archaeon]
LTGQATIDAFGSDRISEYIQGLVSALLVAPWSLAAYLLVYLHVKGRWHLPGLRQKK